MIGGGITGAGIARDAARRGLSTTLVEMRDLAFGTSSRSSKLVHGGLRYLEQYEFSLVFEAVSERRILMDIPDEAMKGIRSASEPYARLLAGQIRQRFGTDWGLSETGATGPTGNRYGDAAGHSCMGLAGPENAVSTASDARRCAEGSDEVSSAYSRTGTCTTPPPRGCIDARSRCCLRGAASDTPAPSWGSVTRCSVSDVAARPRRPTSRRAECPG